MKKLVCLFLCLLMLVTSTAWAETLFTRGTFEAEAQGFGGPVKVIITVDEDEILSVVIEGPSETLTLGGVAVDTMDDTILAARTPHVDGVSGATVTSTAIIAAATEALQAAGADIDVLDEKRLDVAGDTAKEEKTIDTDVAIVGAGGAGMAAAIMLKQAGVNFVILEKMPYVGGNRLGGNAVADIVIFGRIAAQSATEYVK